jgi:hypothetical protein
MQAGITAKAGFLGVALFALSSCEEGAPFGQQTFRAQYAVAREALESGHYEKASRGYLRLMEQAGPFAPRIRLEYAHTLLRKGDYAQAAQQASSLAQGQKGKARAAALAVKGTAEHELALQLIGEGERAGAKRYLDSADRAMAEVLKKHPDMDPVGALASRRASIKVRRASL